MVTNEKNQTNVKLAYGHHLQRAHHQAIVYLAFDPLDESLIFVWVLGQMHQQLSKCETTNREGMDKKGAGDKAVTLEQLQQPLSIIQTPAGPQELFHLVVKKKKKEKHS